MTDTIRVKPWPGLILAEVPPEGTDLPAELAAEWLDNRLVTRVADTVTLTTESPINTAIRPKRKRRNK